MLARMHWTSIIRRYTSHVGLAPSEQPHMECLYAAFLPKFRFHKMEVRYLSSISIYRNRNVSNFACKIYRLNFINCARLTSVSVSVCATSHRRNQVHHRLPGIEGGAYMCISNSKRRDAFLLIRHPLRRKQATPATPIPKHSYQPAAITPAVSEVVISVSVF